MDDPFKSVADSQYTPPFFLRNGHAQTIYPAIARRVRDVSYRRERINTPDNDFLDLDWAITSRPAQRLVILCHGLEGHSNRSYVRGMARAVNAAGWDALAWNYRGCSGEPNRQLRFYHNGATDDLNVVVAHAAQQRKYQRIALIGFSLGGNLVLNYLTWHRAALPPTLCGAVVFSVPLHIPSSAAALAQPANRIYMKRFLKDLKVKITAKEFQFPGAISSDGYDQITDFEGFDDRYTAPLHGFADAMDYWQKCSGLNVLSDIRHPTLIVNAQNDPFLSPECFPVDMLARNDTVHLLTPRHGGHCGFPQFGCGGLYWSEEVACRFMDAAF
ncbi:MAG: alpha/beta fold hydrolase [Deltaproteobacteria bacterium]|nr:alpha/beta fold hydrolase [Deltaproteobacteria bacterium]